MTDPDRGVAMAASLARTARSFGVGEAGTRLVAAAHEIAMAPRAGALEDDHHPSYLHPGRVALILLRDVGVTDAEILAAACLAESEEKWFQVGEEDVRRAFGARVAALSAVPPSDAEDLIERLVTAPEDARLVALAERLDQVRHAHLRDRERSWRVGELARVRAAYLPVAERTHPRLAQRFRHWSVAFARRLGVG